MEIGMIKQLLLITIALSLSACSFLTTQPDTQTVTMSWEAPQKLYFSGKGAGAGMALMSTMGPMGMAIGVAIDEGISKDIASAQAQTGQEIKQIISNQASNKTVNWSSNGDADSAEIIIKRIEFKLVRGGENDATEIHIKFLDKRRNSTQEINYPKDFPNHKASAFPLNRLKEDGDLSNKLLAEAFDLLLR